MRKLLIISLLFLYSCNKNKTEATPAPTLGDALSQIGVGFLYFYEATDPRDSQQVLFRMLGDSSVYEFKNDYSSQTICNYWVSGSGSNLEVNFTAEPGTFEVHNDPLNGLGDTVMDYYFVNRAAVLDTIRLYKDANGKKHLATSGFDVIFQQWQP